VGCKQLGKIEDRPCDRPYRAGAIDHPGSIVTALAPSRDEAMLAHLKRSLPPLFAFLGAFGLAAIDWQQSMLRDADTYWHIIVGRWIIAHRMVPHHDVFSYTFMGRPWIAHEWLSEVVIATIFDHLGGWTGIVVCFSLAFAATVYLLTIHLGHFLGTVGTVALVLLASFSMMVVLLARPHELALPLVEIWTASLVVARARERPPSWWLVPVMTLWANLHGSFMIGLALTGALGAEAVLAQRSVWWATTKRWGGFLAACIAAASLSPNFPDVFLLPIRFLHMTTMFAIIDEWRSPNFQRLDPLEMIVILTLLFSLWRGLKLPPIRLILFVGLIYSAFQHMRNEVMVGIVGSLLLAPALARQLGSRPYRPSSLRWPDTVGFEATVATPALLVVILMVVLAPVKRVTDDVTPDVAVAHVPAALRDRPVFNKYSFGGYLIFDGVKPFIDGRADMYGEVFLQDYVDAAAGNEAVMNRLFKQYDIVWSLMPPDSAVVAVLDASPDWQRVFADKIAVVQVRKDALPPRGS
jgi:hypothetical protein